MYYGSVSGNADPQGKNRCLLRVPQLLGSAVTTWAVSMTPVSSPPAVGSLVAVVFLGGDLDHPAYMVINPQPPPAAAPSLPAGFNGELAIDSSNQGAGDVSANIELFSKNASGNGQTAVVLNGFTVFMQGGFQTGATSNATIGADLFVGGNVTAANFLLNPPMAVPFNRAQIDAGTATLAQVNAFLSGLVASLERRGLMA